MRDRQCFSGIQETFSIQNVQCAKMAKEIIVFKTFLERAEGGAQKTFVDAILALLHIKYFVYFQTRVTFVVFISFIIVLVTDLRIKYHGKSKKDTKIC